MSFYYSFSQWEPKPDVHSVDDSYASDLRGHDVDDLLSHWANWCSKFLPACKIITLAVNKGEEGRSYVQLRFWFGEPSSIRPGYVGSMGHNLIVHVSGPVNELALYRLLRDRMIDDLHFNKKQENGVEVWRRK